MIMTCVRCGRESTYWTPDGTRHLYEATDHKTQQMCCARCVQVCLATKEPIPWVVTKGKKRAIKP